MNSSFVSISILAKSNISRECLINFLTEVSSQSLRSYLKLANIYDGNSNKRKSYLIEMIVYWCIINKLSKNKIEDISKNDVRMILKDENINIKPLPGYENCKLKKKDIKPYEDECSIKIKEWLLYYYFI